MKPFWSTVRPIFNPRVKLPL